MNKNKQQISSRATKAILGVAGLILSWLLFIRAVDTGSLQQYGLLILLFGFSVNRLFRSAFPKKT